VAARAPAGTPVRGHRLRPRSRGRWRGPVARRRARARRSVRALSRAHRSEQRVPGADSPFPPLRRAREARHARDGGSGLDADSRASVDPPARVRRRGVREAL
jgi:hypothetical protein